MGIRGSKIVKNCTRTGSSLVGQILIIGTKKSGETHAKVMFHGNA